MRWFLVSLLVACHGAPPAQPNLATGKIQRPGPTTGEITSNILRADYAGSQACRRCHPAIYQAWQGSPMHNMTRELPGAKLHAPFAGERFTFKNDSMVLDEKNGQRWMRLHSASRGDEVYRLTKVIGGHHREDFVGVQEGKPAVERVMPASFAIAAGEWRYKGYSVMSPERPELRAGAVWKRTCVFCHNTEPYLSVLAGPLSVGAGPYQGAVVDSMLPAGKRAKLAVTDEAGLSRAFSDELRHLGQPVTPADAASVVKATRLAFDAKNLVEVGIGCESCHGGSRVHTEHPGVTPSYRPRSDFLKVTFPDDPDDQHRRAREINRVCARCHQVLFSRYPHTWEGGSRTSDGGGSHINSGEGRDFLLGACAGELSCTTCHDPHASGDGNQKRMAELETRAGDTVCLGCHQKYATDEALSAHAHHKPDGAGARCLSCHLAKKNMSLDHGLGRYHRIGIPTDAARVERDRPIECALCHADRSVRTLLDDMQRFWGKRYDANRVAQLYGGLDVNPIMETLRRGKPHEQATALGVLAEHPDAKATALVAEQFTHRLPIVRYFAVKALAAILGKPIQIDLFRDNAAVATDVAKLTGIQPSTPKPAPANSPTHVNEED